MIKNLVIMNKEWEYFVDKQRYAIINNAIRIVNLLVKYTKSVSFLKAKVNSFVKILWRNFHQQHYHAHKLLIVSQVDLVENVNCVHKPIPF